MNDLVGEVVAVPSIISFQFQQTGGASEVSFGRFVISKHEELSIIGIITDIKILNTSISAFPKPKRLPENTSIQQIFPDLIDQFPTIIDVLVLGYYSGKQYQQDIPDRPPSIYQKVFLMTTDEIKQFHILKNSNKPIIHYLFRLQSFEPQDFSQAIMKKVFSKLKEIFGSDVFEQLQTN